MEDHKKVTDKERIHLILSARYLLNHLQLKIGRTEPISAEVTLNEISKFLKKSQKSVSARVSELKDDNAIESPSKGVYRVKPHTIDGLILKLQLIAKEGKNNGK